MTIAPISFTLPNLSDTTLYPTVSHAPDCIDPPPTPSTCFPGTIVIVRPFALPTEPLGQLKQPLTNTRNLIPSPPSVGIQCPSLRFDLVTANAGTMTGSAAGVTFLVNRPEGDACLPVIEPLIVFPCTSITADANGSVTMVNGPGQGVVVHELTPNDTDQSCSTNMQINVNVPCVVPTFNVDQTVNITPGGSVYVAAQTQYATDSAAFSVADAIYSADLALYTSQLATYTTDLATYNTAHAAYLVSMSAYRLALQQQPTPVPLPTAPAAPVAPTIPVQPVGPPLTPPAPTVSSATVTTTPSPITTLTAAMTADAFDIAANVVHTAGFQDGDILQIGNERMGLAGITSGTLTVARAAAGSSLETHAIGDEVTVAAPTGGKVNVLVQGPPCDRVITLGINLRMPSAASGGAAAAGSSGGGGFTVGSAIPAVSPFKMSAYASTLYPPGAVVPLIDTRGVTTAPGTAIDSTVNYITNNTGRTLARGDIVSAWETSASPPVGYSQCWSAF